MLTTLPRRSLASLRGSAPLQHCSWMVSSSTIDNSNNAKEDEGTVSAVAVFRTTNETKHNPIKKVTISDSTNRRLIHSTVRHDQADAASSILMETHNKTSGTTATTTNALLDRFTITAEVTISKIFPAGFGWQSASVIAGASGLATDSLNFALSTGAGDALGVFGGHMAYYAAKKSALGDPSIDMTKEMHTGILLGTAAFCSGTAWQPIVNALQGADLPFMHVFAGTWLGCGVAFYAGLRLGRTFLSGQLRHVKEPTYENSKTDMSLSSAIGGATGFFVGTDAAYLPTQNFLIDIVGIKAGTPDLVGCAIAGTSTSLGFVTAQTTLNMIYPAGKCWND